VNSGRRCHLPATVPNRSFLGLGAAVVALAARPALGSAPRQPPAPMTRPRPASATGHRQGGRGRPHSVLKVNRTSCHGAKAPRGGGKTGVFAFKSSNRRRKTARCLSAEGACNATRPPARRLAAPLPFRPCQTLRPVDRGQQELLICHQEVFAEFSSAVTSPRKQMTCATCHDPHAPAAVAAGQVRPEDCLQCHPDRAGLRHEHGLVVEGCHLPRVHGSTNRHMLVQQSVADLCFSCHAGHPAGTPT
jgi:predicted CXXCH cytochrome family protein